MRCAYPSLAPTISHAHLSPILTTPLRLLQALSSLSNTLDARETKLLATWRDLNLQLNNLRNETAPATGDAGLDGVAVVRRGPLRP